MARKSSKQRLKDKARKLANTKTAKRVEKRKGR